MTDNLPAIRSEAPVSQADTDSWIQVMGPLVKLSETVATTEFVPKNLRGKPAAVTAALLYGREVGLAPMTALTMTHVVEGKPAMSAEGMRALVLAAGHELEVLEASGGMVRMRGRRRGSDTWTSLEWSIDMARAAGLLTKDNWRHYPRQMLTARCTAELCRMVFPDVIHGFRAIEELDETEETTSEPVQVQATTKVRRNRKTTAALPSPAAVKPEEVRPSSLTGVPLPGEEGYEDLTPQAASETDPEREAGDVSEASDAGEEPTPEDSSPAPNTPSEQPAGEVESTPTPPRESQGAPSPAGPRKVSRAQLRMLQASVNGLGVDDRDDRLSLVSRIVGRDVDSTANLTVEEASAVIDTVARVKTREDLEALLEAQE